MDITINKEIKLLGPHELKPGKLYKLTNGICSYYMIAECKTSYNKILVNLVTNDFYKFNKNEIVETYLYKEVEYKLIVEE